MNYDLFVLIGLSLIFGLVLALPFSSKKVEDELEAFLFIMGILSVSIARLWSWPLVHEALVEPIKITLAVLFAGLLFRALRKQIVSYACSFTARFGHRAIIFLLVAGLGLLSSVVSAIIAALILAEVIAALDMTRAQQIRVTIIACFSIGLGAVLTPLGEPLATIAVAKLRGEPHYANFWFLLRHLGPLVVPSVIILGIYAAFTRSAETGQRNHLTEDRQESYLSVGIRAFKVYLFVLALVFLGTGFKPVCDKYLTEVPAWGLYWINMISAILDNATLTAAEMTPIMSLKTIIFLLMGLLISGGMLIPGNIPNIICASKLSIKSKDWAALGVPLGMTLMILFFFILTFGEAVLE